MIRTLTLENYRSFASYELRDLARVNLLVGPNNCGKTSVLEAVHFLAAQGNPRVLVDSTRRRGEFLVNGSPDTTEDYVRSDPHDLSHHFHGHRLDIGARFCITADDELGQIVATIEQADDEQSEDLFDLEAGRVQALILRITGGRYGSFELDVNDDGSFAWNRRTLRTVASTARSVIRPVRFVTVESLDSRSLASLWNKVVVEGREFEVEEAMRILEPRLESIRFLTPDGSPRLKTARGIVLGFKGAGRRVPLGSQGEGTRRLLALCVPLTELANGVFLIDEIDTGLHWTVMEDMWRLLIETARESSIQVFATTHSYDCVAGLAAVLTSHPEFTEDVSIQKLERTLLRAVAFGSENIRVAAEQRIELR